MLRTLLLVIALVAAPLAHACEGDKVKVTLVVILASEDGDKIDPKLKAIAAEVQKLNPNLKSFRLKTMTSKSLEEKETASFPLIDDKTAQITVRHGADEENRIVLAVSAPNQGEIVYRTVCGKFLPIVTRCHTQPHDQTRQPRERLILAIRVQPCQDD